MISSKNFFPSPEVSSFYSFPNLGFFFCVTTEVGIIATKTIKYTLNFFSPGSREMIAHQCSLKNRHSC